MSQLFTMIEAYKTDQEKVAVLQEYESAALVTFLRSCLPGAKWLVSPDDVSYEPNKSEPSASLFDSASRFYLFCNLERYSPLHADQKKLRRVFGEFLSEHPKEECELITNFASKNRLPPGLSLRNVYDAYPELAPNHVAAEKQIKDEARRNAKVRATDQLISAQVNLRTEIAGVDKEMAELNEKLKILTTYKRVLRQSIGDSAATLAPPSASEDRARWLKELKATDDEQKSVESRTNELQTYHEILYRKLNHVYSEMSGL